MDKLLIGRGVNNNTYPSRVDGMLLREHCLWQNMLSRCKEKFWIKRPTYIGTTCSENFKNYSFFYEWCNQQKGFSSVDEKGNAWHLDKDILVKGNKLYSEDTCVFIPQSINSLLLKSEAARGKLPIGVYWNKSLKYFVSKCKVGGVSMCLGYFTTKEQAFHAYKTFKETLIKEVANEYRTQIDPHAYNALMNYKVDEND